MNKKINLIMLTVLLLTMVMGLIPTQKASALGLSDIDIKYDVTTDKQGNVSGTGINTKDTAMERDKTSQESFWTKIFGEYKGIIMGISGLGTLTFIIFFVMNFIKLGKSADNPNDRSKALSGLLWTGIATAGFGGVTVFVGLFANLITG